IPMPFARLSPRVTCKYGSQAIAPGSLAGTHWRLNMKDTDCCLVIDDVRALRKYASSLIFQTIANPSLHIVEADSTNAVEQFSKHKPGMVIMDAITRVRNGLGLARFIW